MYSFCVVWSGLWVLTKKREDVLIECDRRLLAGTTWRDDVGSASAAGGGVKEMSYTQDQESKKV